MKISEELAKIIVDNIHEVIPEEINFINADGLIIARSKAYASSAYRRAQCYSKPRAAERAKRYTILRCT